MTGGETYSIVVLTAEEAAARQPPVWHGFAVGVVLLALMALLARHRAARLDARLDAGPASRVRRIGEAAFVWAAAWVAMRTAGFAEYGQDRLGDGGIVFALRFLIDLLMFMVTAILLLGTADLLLDMAAPRRTRLWLLAGPLLLALFGTGFLAATGWMEIVTGAGPRDGMLFLGALIAGLSWWSRLPAAEAERTAAIFD